MFNYIPDPEDWPLSEPPPATVASVIENGALSDILKLDLAELVPASTPENERLRLSVSQIARLTQLLGASQIEAWGIGSASGL